MNSYQIELAYLRGEESLVNRLTNTSKVNKLLFTIIMLGLFYWIIKPLLSLNYPSWSRFDLIQDRVWFTLGLAVLSPLYFIVHDQLRTFFFIAVMFAVWTTCGMLLGLKLGIWILHPLSFYLMYFVLKKINFKNSNLNYFIKPLLLLTLFWFDLYTAGITAVQNSTNYLTLISKFRFEYVLAFAISLVFSQNKNTHLLVLHPLQISHAFPLPEDSEFSTQRKIWWKGFINLSFGVLLTWLVSQITSINIKSVGISAVILYIYFCLFVISIMNITTGLARMYGLNVRDGTYFLVFAKSPLDFWRRSSTFLYHFILNNVYLPVAKLTRSTVLAISCSAVVSIFQIFLLHEIFVRAFINMTFPELSIGATQIQTLVLVSIGYVGLWIGAEFIHRLLVKFLVPFLPASTREWFLISLTHFLIIFLTYLFLKMTQ